MSATLPDFGTETVGRASQRAVPALPDFGAEPARQEPRPTLPDFGFDASQPLKLDPYQQAVAAGTNRRMDAENDSLLRAVAPTLAKIPGKISNAVETVASEALNLPQELWRADTGGAPKVTVTRTDANGRTSMGEEDAPLFFQPGVPVLKKGPFVGDDPVNNLLNKLLTGATTPGNLATLPLAEANLVKGYFLTQTVPGVAEGVATAFDSSKTPKERTEGALSAGVNGLFSYLLRFKQGSTESRPTSSSSPTAAQPNFGEHPAPSIQHPVPESAPTLAAQVALAQDPASARAAVHVTPGESVPSSILNAPSSPALVAVEVPGGQGTVLVNPDKANPQAVADAAATGEHGQYLGMGSPAKPEAGTAVLQTKNAAGTPVLEEVISPATLPAAISAATIIE